SSEGGGWGVGGNAGTRRAEGFRACAEKGGLVGTTGVPNSLSNDPHQNINSVLDHYDYLVKLVGVEHVGIGTDTLVGDHVGFHKLGARRRSIGGLPKEVPAAYLDGLESPADGKKLIPGLIARGHSDHTVPHAS